MQAIQYLHAVPLCLAIGSSWPRQMWIYYIPLKKVVNSVNQVSYYLEVYVFTFQNDISTCCNRLPLREDTAQNMPKFNILSANQSILNSTVIQSQWNKKNDHRIAMTEMFH